MTAALADFRICDFTGQLAGAGATKWLAAFGAEVIRIEDPTREGRWDIMRGGVPFADERRGINLGGSFNNHNTGKLGITLNLRTAKGKEILPEIIKRSDAVTVRDRAIPVSAVQKPRERIDQDPTTNNFGLWPTVTHTEMGNLRVDGLPVHLSQSDWKISRGAPCLGEHTEEVLINLLGMSKEDVQTLRQDNVI